jgi:hypothetical protein
MIGLDQKTCTNYTDCYADNSSVADDNNVIDDNDSVLAPFILLYHLDIYSSYPYH